MSNPPVNAPQDQRRNPFVHLGHPDEHIPMFDPPETPSAPIAKKWLFVGWLVLLAIAWMGAWFEHVGEHAITPDVALAWMIPFAALLIAIAAMPFIARHFWEHYYPHVAIGLGLIVVFYYAFFLKAPVLDAGIITRTTSALPSMAKSFGEYIAFIYLLGSLFVVSGGILIRVRTKATPVANVVLLLIGALIANVFGTTGAAMLLIRPYLRMNAGHLKPYHIVFFIFMVANVGGALTPIGDPPLFLGYLKGVPFWWVLEHCWPLWAVAVGLLLAIFFVWDMLASRKLAREKPAGDFGPAVSIYGASNLLFIGMILAAVFIDPPYREMLMATALIGSLLTTARRVHVENHFNFAPIREVALLFIGIFATMVPALNYLSTHAGDPAFKNALSTPGQYYYVTGTLSSVLDNAPTYLTFLETELGKLDPAMVHVAQEVARKPGHTQPTPLQLAGLTPDQQKAVPGALTALRYYHGDRIAHGTLSSDEVKVGFLIGDPELNEFLVAISLGAVFFGAMTYIGNGPNFMVKAIAEQAGADCPSFFGYIIAYSLPILLPVLIIVWFIFLY